MRTRSLPDRPSRTRRRAATVAVATVFALGSGALVAAPAQAADPVIINLVTINDFHGRIQASTPANPGVLGGISALAQAVNGIRAENPNTVFAAAGDLIGASTFTSFIQKDVPTIETLNDAGLEVSAAGNHEFDKGWEDLEVRVQGLADWEYIAANVYEKSTGQPALAESWIKEMDGIRVGFIGAVTEELPSLVSPEGIQDIEVRDIVDTVNAVADEMTDGAAANGEADVIVLLIHEGAGNTTYATATDSSTPFGWIVNNLSPKVNAIVSGHTHLAYDHSVPYAGDTGLRPVISSGQYGEKFSNMEIAVDPDSKQILSMDNETIDMWWDHDGVSTTPVVPRYTVPAGDPIEAKVTEAANIAKIEGAVPLGTISADLNRAKMSTGAENRGGESTLGNFVADAQLWAAQQREPETRIAFMNPGGLRADMLVGGTPEGVLTFEEAANVQNFANTLVTTTLTGAQIRQALEQQWQPAGASRPFLKLGISAGFEYVYDPTAAAGSRITRMTLDGVDIDPAASFRVVVNSFLGSGGDNFGALGQGVNKRDTGLVDLESMVDYMAEIGNAAPDYAQRSIGATLPAAGSLGYAVGSTFDLPLASLDFSTTEPRVQTVDVSIAGKPAGSAPVVLALPGTHADGSGTATVSVKIPAGVTGKAKPGTPVTVPLTVTTAQGTSVELPIKVFEKVSSLTIGWPSKILAKKGTSISYTTDVTVKGVVPTGAVTIYDGSKQIATATLTAADKGRITVKLPALARGVHLLWAEYAGDATVKGSKAPKLPVLIL